MTMKLNVLLALTDALRVKYKNMVADHTLFYNKKQGNFMGIRNTYDAREGTVDDFSKKKFVRVVTTVDEKLEYFVKEAKEFVDALFSQERTNATGIATAHLVVNDVDWGEFTSLELLRLKSLLESSDLGNIESMLSGIPVRPDNVVWHRSTDEDYKERAIWATKQVGGVARTTEKEEVIMVDPNLANIDGAKYIPKTTVKTKTIEIGDYTTQVFSGEWSHVQRAGTLKRRNDLTVAVLKALKECNDCIAAESSLTADRIFGFILNGVNE